MDDLKPAAMYIPKMRNLGHWVQPSVYAIDMNDEFAVMSALTFHVLQPSTGIPSMAIEGMMWKKQVGDDWLLCWIQSDVDFVNFRTCQTVHTRKILIREMLDLLDPPEDMYFRYVDGNPLPF